MLLNLVIDADVLQAALRASTYEVELSRYHLGHLDNKFLKLRLAGPFVEIIKYLSRGGKSNRIMIRVSSVSLEDPAC